MHRPIIIVFFTILFFPSPLHADWVEESGILEPVQIFDQYYGIDQMDKVAQVTSRDFREGQSKSAWAEETASMLRRIEYERLDSEYIGAIANDDRTAAAVLMESTIQTIVGKVRHDELFRLVRDGDTWLIDELEITSETILPKTFDL